MLRHILKPSLNFYKISRMFHDVLEYAPRVQEYSKTFLRMLRNIL